VNFLARRREEDGALHAAVGVRSELPEDGWMVARQGNHREARPKPAVGKEKTPSTLDRLRAQRSLSATRSGTRAERARSNPCCPAQSA